MCIYLKNRTKKNTLYDSEYKIYTSNNERAYLSGQKESLRREGKHARTSIYSTRRGAQERERKRKREQDIVKRM